jgi:hypothetical protein
MQRNLSKGGGWIIYGDDWGNVTRTMSYSRVRRLEDEDSDLQELKAKRWKKKANIIEKMGICRK